MPEVEYAQSYRQQEALNLPEMVKPFIWKHSGKEAGRCQRQRKGLVRTKNQALLDAFVRRNFEFVELLLKLGADICSAPFSEVLLSRAAQLSDALLAE